jgi:hypothetical protein
MATVAAIIDQNAGEVEVHTTDPSIVRNPHDHFDHRMAGLLVADGRKSENWNVSYYVGYALATRATNRTTRQTQAKTAVFLAYDREMTTADKKWSAYREHPLFYSECLQRTYVRHLPPPRRGVITAPSRGDALAFADTRLSATAGSTRFNLDVINVLGRKLISTGFSDPSGRDVAYFYPIARRTLQLGVGSAW